MDFSEILGLLRSLVIYYGHPLRHRRLMRLYAPFIQPGELVFDIGAHVGNHTRVFHALGARVISFEPQPVMFGFLKRVFGRRSRVTIVDCAVGREDGESRLHISRRTPTVSTITANWLEATRQAPSFSHVDWDRQMIVQVRALDRLVAEFGEPAFVKIDVEGGEFDVLQGLTRPLPALSFEVLPAAAEDGVRCLDQLAGLGKYQYNWSEGESARLQPNWADEEGARRRILALEPTDREINVFARIL